MIELIETALTQKYVFIFKCHKISNQESDDKEAFLELLKEFSMNSDIMIKQEMFHFDYKQAKFEKVKDWGIDLAKDSIENIDLLALDFSRLQKRYKEIEDKQIIFLTQKEDLKNLLTHETQIQLSPSDRNILSLINDRIEHVNQDISNNESIIENIKRQIESIEKEDHCFINNSKEDNRFWFYKIINHLYEWKYGYEYPYKRGTTIFGRRRAFMPIKRVIINISDNENSYDEEFNETPGQIKHDISKDKIGIFKITADFQNGIFEFDFQAAIGFIGAINIKIFIVKDHIKEFKTKKQLLENSLKIKEQEILKEKKEIEDLDEKLKKEKNILDMKSRYVSDKSSLIKCRLETLNFDTNKFIKYLLQVPKVQVYPV
jgi:hypothetical protein